MTHDEMLTALRDIRLPDNADGGLLAECLVAVSLGLLLAFALSLVARLFTETRSDAKQPETVGDRLTQLRNAPAQQRAVALLHLIRQNNPDAYNSLKGDLYSPDGNLPDMARLEAALDPTQVLHG